MINNVREVVCVDIPVNNQEPLTWYALEQLFCLIGYEGHDDIFAISPEAILDEFLKKSWIVVMEIDVGNDVAWQTMEEAIVEHLLISLKRVEQHKTLVVWSAIK